MTQKEKQLLFKDLCGRLPHNVIVGTEDGDEFLIGIEYGESFLDKDTVDKTPQFTTEKFGGQRFVRDIEEIKLYLRPLSSMTEEEINEFVQIRERVLEIGEKKYTCILSLEQVDWLNKNHFDYRGLIPMGLALEASEDMYKTK